MEAPDDQVTYDTLEAFQGDYGAAGCTLKEIAKDYDFPLEFLVNSVCDLGVVPPIDSDKKVSDLLSGERIYALVEALTTIDPAEAYDRFADHNLAEIADYEEVPLTHIFQICAEYGFNLPLGVRTHLKRDEYSILLKEITGYQNEDDVP